MDVVVDTCVIIDLAEASSMEAFGEVPDMTYHLTDSVEWEVKYASQKKMLQAEIARGAISRIKLEDMDALCVYASLRDKNHEGECACLALADMNGWHVATSETKRRFMKHAAPLVGENRIVRTADILRHRRRSAAE